MAADHWASPRLTFACELDPPRLAALFADGTVVADIQALGASVAMMLSDLSDERAEVVRKLNAAAVPVVAVPLLPLEDGYYFTADNWQRAAERYDAWRTWTARHGLAWAGPGLDIEPDARAYLQLMANPWGLLPMLLPRLFDAERPRRARAAYAALVDRARADGYAVENYQFPIIAEERRAGSTLLQRLLGLVDMATDREVWILYTSFAPAIGPGILWRYAREARAVAVGTTGAARTSPATPRCPRSAGTRSRGTCAWPGVGATTCTSTASKAACGRASCSASARSTGSSP